MHKKLSMFLRVHKTKGFTIVELLVVIVVIGILASIVIVAYNGVQTRAKNAKTVSAATAYIKAIKMYKAEKGSWPDASCLGDTSTYIGQNGQCWDNAYWVVRPSFLEQLRPYIEKFPYPDTTDLYTTGSSGSPKRGALFNNNGSNYRWVYLMLSDISQCPSILGLPKSYGIYGNGLVCQYNLDV